MSHWGWNLPLFWGIVFLLSTPSTTEAGILTVGPGKQFSRIESAYQKARPGDTILVYPLPKNRPYSRVALWVNKKNITFRGVSYRKKERVKLSGRGYDYSGRGCIPRSLFQFNNYRLSRRVRSIINVGQKWSKLNIPPTPGRNVSRRKKAALLYQYSQSPKSGKKAARQVPRPGSVRVRKAEKINYRR